MKFKKPHFIVDYNKIQALTKIDDALSLDNLPAKFRAFNWDCNEINDGHSFDDLIPSLLRENSSIKPKVFIVHTTKGKGIKSFENDPAWHARKIKGEDLLIGKKELGII